MTNSAVITRNVLAFKRHPTLKYEVQSFKDVCEAVNTPRSLACYLMAQYAEWEQYLMLTFPDTEAASFADDYLVTNILKKNPHLPIRTSPRDKAECTWLEAESLCGTTNELWRAVSAGNANFRKEVDIRLEKVRRIIARILGPLTRADLEYAESKFRFGPGATSAVTGYNVLKSKKMTSTFDVTPRLYPFWRSITTSRWQQDITSVNLVGASKVTFVPKTALTDRAIAIEPHGNIYVQLGIGALLRKKLKSAGLDLDNQAELNRAAAKVAQAQGLATIDLSSASDTIAYLTVWNLLPHDWACLLDVARTEYSIFRDREVRLEKYSSMGNGYTFELESLIFWAVSLSVSRAGETVMAFGDDIIIPAEHAAKLREMLWSLGFKVNEQKSFITGCFFESCGTDYHHGRNVRPFYFKGEYHSQTAQVISMANAVRQYAARRSGFGCDARFKLAWHNIIHRCAVARSTGCPPELGDVGLTRNWDEATPSKPRHGHEGWVCQTFSHRPVKARHSDPKGLLLARLHESAGRSDAAFPLRYRYGRFRVVPGQQHRPLGSRSSETIRGRVEDGKLTQTVAITWTDLGPWL